MSYHVPESGATPNRQEPTTTEYLGHTINFCYFPERITLAWVGKLQSADDLNDIVMLTNLIEYVLGSWDVTMGGPEAGPFPPTSENLQLIPLGLLMNILEAMQAHQEVIRKGGPKIPLRLQSFLHWFGEKWQKTAPDIHSKMRP